MKFLITASILFFSHIALAKLELSCTPDNVDHHHNVLYSLSAVIDEVPEEGDQVLVPVIRVVGKVATVHLGWAGTHKVHMGGTYTSGIKDLRSLLTVKLQTNELTLGFYGDLRTIENEPMDVEKGLYEHIYNSDDDDYYPVVARVTIKRDTLKGYFNLDSAITDVSCQIKELK